MPISYVEYSSAKCPCNRTSGADETSFTQRRSFVKELQEIQQETVRRSIELDLRKDPEVIVMPNKKKVLEVTVTDDTRKVSTVIVTPDERQVLNTITTPNAPDIPIFIQIPEVTVTPNERQILNPIVTPNTPKISITTVRTDVPQPPEVTVTPDERQILNAIVTPNTPKISITTVKTDTPQPPKVTTVTPDERQILNAIVTPNTPKISKTTIKTDVPQVSKVTAAPNISINTGSSAIQRTALTLVNEIREQNGAAPLSIDERLSEESVIWSEELAKLGELKHDTGPFAENIAMHSSIEASIQAWSKSEGHFRNMVNPVYITMGVGVDRSGRFYTMRFK